MRDYIIGFTVHALVWCIVQMACFLFIKNSFFRSLPLTLITIEFLCVTMLGLNGLLVVADALTGFCGVFVACVIYVIYSYVRKKKTKEQIKQEESATITEDK